MTINVKIGCEALVARARAAIETVPVEEAVALHGTEAAVFVDLRDVRELEREGAIPGAFHMPRGMLEFWLDPASPYHKDVFDADKRFLFFCNRDWRSALATERAQEMGLERASHIEGGFTAWKAAGGAVEERKRRG